MSSQKHLSNVKRIIALAMREPEVFVVQMTYEDRKGERTRRVVSPTKFVDQHRFAALCLCREQVRNFYFSNIENVVLQHSEDVLMPVEIERLPRLHDARLP